MLTTLGHAAAIAVTIAAWSLAGKALLPRAARQAEPCLFWSSALALGAGVTALLVTGAVAAGGFGRATAWSIAVVVLALAVLGARRRDDSKEQGDPPVSFYEPGRSGGPAPLWRKLTVAVLVMALLATMLATMAPPSSMDAAVYHLRVARQFVDTGGWTEIPEVVQSYQPLYVQMLFAQALALWDDVFAALMHWALGLGAVLAAGAWSRRLGGSALLGMVIFGLGALFTWESTSAFIDLALTLFASLGLLWATRADEPGALWVAAVFAGLAAGSKLTGGVAALLTALLAAAFATHGRRSAWRNVGFVVAVSFAVALPWYLRNVWFTGNPVFPVGNVWLGLPHRPLAVGQYGYGVGLLHLLTSPLDLVWRGDPFDKGWAVGPAYLALAPIGIYVTWKHKAGRAATAVIAAWWVMWFFSSQQTRLLLPILPIAAALASAGAVAALAAHEKWVRRAAVALLVSAASLGAAFSAMAVKTYGPAALGRETRPAFLSRMSWHYDAFEATNRRLGPHDRVAVSGADNLYYLRIPARAIGEYQSPLSLRTQGFTHVLHLHPCEQTAQVKAARTLWRGRYVLRASRMGGGNLGSAVCAELGTTAAPDDGEPSVATAQGS